MSIIRRIVTSMRLLFRRETVEAELDSEVLEFYQTMVDRYVEQGMPEQEARRLARLKFGGVEQVKEEVRESRTGSTLDSILRDVRYAFRGMRKAPSFALVTILTLAIGIGSNATIFSIVSRFILQHLPVRDPATLVAVVTTFPGRCSPICASRTNRFPASVPTLSWCPLPWAAAGSRNGFGDRPYRVTSSTWQNLA
jgi:hypothetical protein